jgi:hypothetical protein
VRKYRALRENLSLYCSLVGLIVDIVFLYKCRTLRENLD